MGAGKKNLLFDLASKRATNMSKRKSNDERRTKRLRRKNWSGKMRISSFVQVSLRYTQVLTLACPDATQANVVPHNR
jgi:hypothetical protein